MAKPPPPGNVRVQGEPKTSGMSTHRKYSVRIRAEINGISGKPKGNQVRLIVQWSTNKNFASSSRVKSEYGDPNRNESVVLEGLVPNTHYYFRAYTKQKEVEKGDERRSNPSNGNFWTERRALAPDVYEPADNAVFAEGTSPLIRWRHLDADAPEDPQYDAQVQWREAGTLFQAPGPWVGIGVRPEYPGTFRPAFNEPATAESWEIPGTFLSGGVYYQYRVRTRDVHLLEYGPWSPPRTFYIASSSTPPLPVAPSDSEAVSIDDPVRFAWRHRDPAGDTQYSADIRYRAVGAEDWTTLTGDTIIPGGDQFWDVDPTNFFAGNRYEWQVRTSTGPGLTSGWSKSEFFWAIDPPGGDTEFADDTLTSELLGCGTYEVYIYEQGGQVLRGKVEPIRILRWHRVRDDISTCNIFTNGFGADCCELLSQIHSWSHEVVVFRDGVRVWEGPITRIGYEGDGVEIEARDVMAYVYRRALRQGYNDNFSTGAGAANVAVGPRSVVDRAAINIANGMAPHDPNVLRWLTRFDHTDDAKESRIVAAWSRSVWEDVDDMAAHAGLDYTVSGRRIILWDTHRRIGLLPELTSEDFFDSPIITEYGMRMANIFGVTNNSGVVGVAYVDPDEWGGLGPLEMIASEYGESDTGGSQETLTGQQLADKQETLRKQAERNIEGRWSFPTVVRIPDNTRLSPSVPIGINQLIPGVHIPLRAKTVCKEHSQVQKLDSLSVEVLDDGDEKVRVVLSPATEEDEAGPEIEVG